MNLLITSIGQRGYLVDHFKDSSNGEFGVYAADATKYAPALQNADKSFLMPFANDPRYYEKLLKICKENDIKGIISINDLELPILAKYKEAFRKEDIMAIVSEPDTVEICFDKYKTYQFCIENNIGVPRTYLWNDKEKLEKDIEDGIITFPMIAKPRKGSRSVGIHLVHDMEQLINDIEELEVQSIPEDEKLMFQEYIDSEQYSVHVFNDKDLEPVNIVTMVNIFKHFGETFHIKTFRDDSLIDLGMAIGDKLKHFGPLSADVHQRDNGEYVVLEFNPRISGCYSLSHFAGADYPSKIYSLMKDESIKEEKVDEFNDCVMLKQFTTQALSEKEITKKVKNR